VKLSTQETLILPLFSFISGGRYYSGRQSQQSFLLLSPSTQSLHVSARAGHLQVNIFFEATGCNSQK
jgi:hypothetical protein